MLQAFSPQNHTLTARDLAESTGIPLPSMYRYIALLRETGLLVGDDHGAYHLSARLISLARAAEAAESIIDIADPIMRRLMGESGETVILVRLFGRIPVCVHRVESAHHLRATFEPGQPLPLERGASGRVLLAGLGPQLRREFLASVSKENPVAAARLERSVAETIERGWAVTEEEIDRGVWAASAAVSDGRSTVAALTVPSPLVRSPAELQERLLSQVRAAAREVTDRLRAAGGHRVLCGRDMTRSSGYSAGMPNCARSRQLAMELPGLRGDPETWSVAGLGAAMAGGDLTATTLTRHYLDRIEELNPVLNAVIAVSPDAMEQAAASDRARESGGPRGPLEGIPVLVKDNVQVAGMPTTAGSSALLPARSPDAFIVSRLRAAGAIILAKANLSEWANFRSTHSTSGWSTVGGQTANPFALDRSPSGSSSGSAAGVSAGLAPLAVGTETDGSIVSPASACGVVGIKPTAGLVSRTGIVPLSPVQDTAGPMANSVADAAAMLSVLAAADPLDPAADSSAGHPERPPGPAEYTDFLDIAALDGASIGIWRAASAPANAATAAVLDAAVLALRALGAKVTDAVDLPDVDKITEPEFRALEYEFKYGINVYLRNLAHRGAPGAVPRSLAELIVFNKRNATEVLARFGQEIFLAAQATSGDLRDPEYLELRGAATNLAVSALESPMAEHKLDAIVSLTANPAWLTDYVLGDHYVFGASRPAAVAGWPAISVPFGYVSGLPVGVTFAGPMWSEARLIALAYAFEQATGGRRAPALLPTIATPVLAAQPR